MPIISLADLNSQQIKASSSESRVEKLDKSSSIQSSQNVISSQNSTESKLYNLNNIRQPIVVLTKLPEEEYKKYIKKYETKKTSGKKRYKLDVIYYDNNDDLNISESDTGSSSTEWSSKSKSKRKKPQKAALF